MMSESDPNESPRPDPPDGEQSTVTLRAQFSRPLSDPRVRAMVVAAAEGIAERTGVRVIDLQCSDDAVTVTLGASDVASIGFAAELRRSTQRWHQSKYGIPLWGPASGPEEERRR
ncbi:MAG: hypothetical protein RIB32_03945 [Phycisphaerales bacterium]